MSDDLCLGSTHVQCTSVRRGGTHIARRSCRCQQGSCDVCMLVFSIDARPDATAPLANRCR
eukprot:3519444-Rhodomonas_salina.1